MMIIFSLYTGFPDYDTLLAFYGTVLEEYAKVMRQSRSGKSKQKLRVVETSNFLC